MSGLDCHSRQSIPTTDPLPDTRFGWSGRYRMRPRQVLARGGEVELKKQARRHASKGIRGSFMPEVMFLQGEDGYVAAGCAGGLSRKAVDRVRLPRRARGGISRGPMQISTVDLPLTWWPAREQSLPPKTLLEDQARSSSIGAMVSGSGLTVCEVASAHRAQGRRAGSLRYGGPNIKTRPSTPLEQKGLLRRLRKTRRRPLPKRIRAPGRSCRRGHWAGAEQRSGRSVEGART